MKRDISSLTNNIYDVLIIGGGIHGACAAWDAAQRGLSVALVEKDDFASATSSQSQKTIHGGLRYLQQLDFQRVRESIIERKILMRIAPHLVHPLPCLMPIYGHLYKGREMMMAGMIMNDMMGFDRNSNLDPQKYIPRSRVISKKECLQIVPSINSKGLTGGAVWYDAQAYNSERLVVSFVLSASDAGATVANYVEAQGFLRDANRVTGIKALDKLNGDSFEIRAQLVLNNSGHWVNHVLNLENGTGNNTAHNLSTAICFVTKKQLFSEYGLGISSADQVASSAQNSIARLFFITPWRNYSLVGTFYEPYHKQSLEYRATEAEVERFLQAFNQSYPEVKLSRDDIAFTYGGLLPMHRVHRRTGEVLLKNHYSIIDHQKRDGISGLVSVVGVKYTTGRKVAEKTVDYLAKKLDKKSRKCATATTKLVGGDIDNFDSYFDQHYAKLQGGLSDDVFLSLLKNYGSKYPEVLKHTSDTTGSDNRAVDTSKRIEAEVRYCVREEMAQKMSDIVFRRTELGSAEKPEKAHLDLCANIMAEELGWDKQQKQREIDEVTAAYIPTHE